MKKKGKGGEKGLMTFMRRLLSVLKMDNKVLQRGVGGRSLYVSEERRAWVYLP